MKQHMNFVALAKGNEQYVFLFDDTSATATLNLLGQYAADKELSFTWRDAVLMAGQVRNLAKGRGSE